MSAAPAPAVDRRAEQLIPAHQFADLFPLHEGPPLWEMSNDIKENGLQDPIVLYKDVVLDGRRRQLACFRAGVKPRFVTFRGDDRAALAFVKSKNLHRRHLGPGEIAIIAGRIANMGRGDNRRPENRENSDREKPREGARAPSIAFPVEENSLQEKPVTAKEAADIMGVSEGTVDKAKKVLQKGTEELVDAVKSGEVSVNDAAKVADETPKMQNQAVADVVNKKANTASQAVKARRSKSQRGRGSQGKPSAKFDENSAAVLFRKMASMIDGRAGVFGKGAEHQNCLDALDALITRYKQWQTATNK